MREMVSDWRRDRAPGSAGRVREPPRGHAVRFHPGRRHDTFAIESDGRSVHGAQGRAGGPGDEGALDVDTRFRHVRSRCPGPDQIARSVGDKGGRRHARVVEGTEKFEKPFPRNEVADHRGSQGWFAGPGGVLDRAKSRTPVRILSGAIPRLTRVLRGKGAGREKSSNRRSAASSTRNRASSGIELAPGLARCTMRAKAAPVFHAGRSESPFKLSGR